MRDNFRTLLQKKTTRKEFLQFIAASVVILLGFGNLAALLKQFTAAPRVQEVHDTDSSHGFGSRKFGA